MEIIKRGSDNHSKYGMIFDEKRDLTEGNKNDRKRIEFKDGYFNKMSKEYSSHHKERKYDESDNLERKNKISQKEASPIKKKRKYNENLLEKSHKRGVSSIERKKNKKFPTDRGRSRSRNRSKSHEKSKKRK